MLLQAQPEATFLWVTTTGWIAIGALVTALMAVATGYLALTSRSEASAARDTVGEIQKDRELTFRPYISWKIGAGTHVLGVNLGKGPALNTVFCVVEQNETNWRWHGELVDFSPGEAITATNQIDLVVRDGPPPPRPQIGQVKPRKVAICEDQLGNRYRFLPGKVSADVWHPGEVKADWVVWYEATAPVAPAL